MINGSTISVMLFLGTNEFIGLLYRAKVRERILTGVWVFFSTHT